jgi:hypothetical protein
LGLIFNIGPDPEIRAEETIVFRKAVGPNNFGHAVDISNDTLIVGAPDKRNGEVYIFARQGDAWIQQAPIKTPQPNLGGWFGGAVCIDGDTAVVGSRAALHGTHDFLGGSSIIYVYQREGKNFLLKQKLSPKDTQNGERFGFAVDLSGDTLVIGAPFHGDGSGPEIGAVYAYVRDQGEFQLQRTFSGELGKSRFGWSVAIDKNTIVVGIPLDRGFQSRGSTNIYVRQGKHWTQQQQAKLWAKGAGQALFGWSVAINGNRVIIGAPYEQQGTGAAYIFRRTGDKWTQQLRLSASNKEIGANFGFAVDIDVDRAVVGVPLEDSVGEDAGAIYSFRREDDTWVEKARFTPKGVIQGEPHQIWEGDVYGSSVAIARKGPYAVVGAPGDNLHRVPPNPSGAVYVYDTEEDFLTPRPVEFISLKATTLGDVKRTALLQNFPNPFNPETWIPYQLAVAANVSITIYTIQGHRVRRIEVGERSAGVYLDKETAVYWDGRSDNGELVSSGVYYYHLRADDFYATRRMVIVK